jgi:hypothetical protein
MSDSENDPKKHGVFGALGDIASALTGGASPQSLADHPGMLPATATIVSDEGYAMAENSQTVALQRETFIVDVHPSNGTDPAIRAEVKCWVSWPGRPTEGDTVPAGYRPGTKEVAILLAGHCQWDWQLAAATKQADDAAMRESLLNAPPDAPA